MNEQKLLDKIEDLEYEIKDLKEYNNELLEYPNYDNLVEELVNELRFDTLNEMINDNKDVNYISDILENIKKLYLKESK